MVLVVVLFFSLSIAVYADNSTNSKTHIVYTEVTYAQDENTIVNGVEEGNYTQSLIGPLAIDYNHPVFIDYVPNSTTEFKFYKFIAGTSYYNAGPGYNPMVLNISSSAQSGSEFTGTVTATGNIQAGILGKVEASFGSSVTLMKSTNQAVGASFTYDVPPYKTGYIDAWWGGVQSYGLLTVKYPDTYSETGYTSNQTSQEDAKVHITANKIHAISSYN